jgi:hypothetical protein
MSDLRFSSSVFFHESVLAGPCPHSGWDRFEFVTKICEDIHNFVFIAGINDIYNGVNDPGDTIAGVVDTADYALSLILIDSMTLVFNFSQVTVAPVMNYRW